MMRGPVLLLLAALVLGAGALVAGVSADQDVGPRALQETAPLPASAQPTPLPAQASPTPAPTPERVSPTAVAPSAPPAPMTTSPGTVTASRALGRPFRGGRLVRGVQLPVSGPDHLTWDAPLQRMPNRPWRRWGTDVLVATLLQVLAEHRVAHPESPPILIGDLSRPTGGIFDQRFGGLGHASHQNGLDVDVYYPRKDRRLVEATRPSQVDRRLSQDLVDRFLAAGAEFVFVGRRVGLRGPKARVTRIAHHDDHLHVRIPDPDGVGR
jgi:murein endopeptidase